VNTYKRQLFGLSIFHAVNDGSLAVFLGALPVMRVAFNLTLIQIGTILSAGLIATVIMQFVFGHLSDKGFARRILIAGVVSLAIIDLLFMEAGDYSQILMFYLLLRAAAGVYHPVSFSTIFRIAQNRPAALGFQSAFGDASLAFAMLSTGFVAESFGWQVPFLIWGLVSAGGVLVFISLIRFQHEASTSTQTPEPSFDGARARGITRNYVVLQFSTVFQQCLFLVFTGFLPLFLNINLKLSPGMSALVVALWLAVGVGAGFSAGRFVALLGGERRTLRISFALTALLLAVSSALILSTQLWAAGLLVLVLSGIPYFLAFPVIYGIVGSTVPRNRLGLAYAANLSFALTAGSALSYATGYLASIFTLFVVLPILVATALAASVIAFIF
jgi:MFS family permease